MVGRSTLHKKCGGKKRHINYPFSKRRVYFSGLLFFLSLLFMLILSEGNVNIIGLYFITTGIIGVLSYFIKIHIYSGKAEKTEYADQRERNVLRAWVTLFLFSLILLCLPFVFFYLFGSQVWLVIVNSYISGVNFPEVIIYLMYCR